jgi:hypothetical protein
MQALPSAFCWHVGRRGPSTPLVFAARPASKNWQMMLALSKDAMQLKKSGFKVRWMTWRAVGLADIARHVIDRHITQETRVQSVMDCVAYSNC